jgi:hypothetical protein
VWSATNSRTVIRLGESRTVSVFATVRWPTVATVERRQALAVGGNRRPPHTERTPKHSALTIGLPGSKPPETHPGHTPTHGHRGLPLSGADRQPYAGAAGQPARYGIWRRTALPACYPIMGLVNQIRDSRVATVISPHAEPGSNCAPSARRLAIGTSGTPPSEVQSQRSRERVNDAFKTKRQLR